MRVGAVRSACHDPRSSRAAAELNMDGHDFRFISHSQLQLSENWSKTFKTRIILFLFLETAAAFYNKLASLLNLSSEPQSSSRFSENRDS